MSSIDYNALKQLERELVFVLKEEYSFYQSLYIKLDQQRDAVKYNKEIDDAGVGDGRVAPMLLPDYTDPRVRKRQLTAHYVGTLR